MAKPLAIDLFCGLGGWTEGFLAEGYDVVGFDIERHVYGDQKYPAQLVLQDVLTLDGRQFRNAAVIVASPPCQAYSYRAMPWKRAKALPPPDNSLFEACFRIAREAGVPLVVENVKGAQKWIGRAAWHYGSFYLWGDIPALMPIQKRNDGRKLTGNNSPRTFQERREQRRKDGLTEGADFAFYLKGSASMDRKTASAQIAKIPFPLAQHIAKVFKPQTSSLTAISGVR